MPKILKPMVDEWTKDGFIVSFKVRSFVQTTAFLLNPKKLETDPTLLIPKARAALERYGHQVVIGNNLHRRKFEVVFVSRTLGTGGSSVDPAFEESWLNIEQQIAGGKEIEEDIVAELVRRHGLWMAHGRDAL